MAESQDSNVDAGIERAERLFGGSPYGRLIGLQLLNLGGGVITAHVPYRPELVGNPETGDLHAGVITTLIDQGCGAAVLLVVGPVEDAVTLDLRIDHLRSPVPGNGIYARCECYHLGEEVAFTRAVAFEEDPSQPFATSLSSYMRLREEAGCG